MFDIIIAVIIGLGIIAGALAYFSQRVETPLLRVYFLGLTFIVLLNIYTFLLVAPTITCYDNVVITNDAILNIPISENHTQTCNVPAEVSDTYEKNFEILLWSFGFIIMVSLFMFVADIFEWFNPDTAARPHKAELRI